MIPVLVSLLVGLVVGAGLTYGFRGLIERTKTKAKAFIVADVQAVHKILSDAVGKGEAELKAAVDSVRMKLAKHLP